MKLTENQFEEIFNKIKDKKEIDFSDIEGFDDFDEDDQVRIIREWTINDSEDYMIDLANKAYTSYDGEPITNVRIAKSFGITISLADKIMDYVILIMDEKIKIPNNKEKCIKSLKRELNPIINNEELEPERRKLLKEELDGICEKGDPERMVAAMMVAKMLRANKHIYQIKGALASSLVAYHLKIHDIDCFKYGCDWHICHGLNFEKQYALEFIVSQEYISQAFSDIEELFYNVPFLKQHTDNIPVMPGVFYLTNDRDIYKFVKTYKGLNGKEYPCLTPDQAINYKNKIVSLYVTARWTQTFLERMDTIYPVSEIDITNTKHLMKFIKNGSLFTVDKKTMSFMKETLKIYNELTYDQLIDIVSKFHGTKNLSDTYLKEGSINTREEAIETLSKHRPYEEAFNIATSLNVSEAFSKINRFRLDYDTTASFNSITCLLSKAMGIAELNDIIRECYYFVNYPEESMQNILETLYTKHIDTHLKIGINFNDEDEHFKNIISNYHSLFTDRYIGIFFYIEGKLKLYKEKLIIDDTKNFIDVDKGHFELFNSYKMPRELEYSMFPRGRILYNARTNTFYLYADKTILNDKRKIKELSIEFNLPVYGVSQKIDEHYKTLRY